MQTSTQTEFISFLQEELAIPSTEIDWVLRRLDSDHDMSQLHMILWQYGLLTLPQLNQALDWLEAS
ncbi:DUF2949 domain-containing protein [Trichothermofontia sp.]